MEFLAAFTGAFGGVWFALFVLLFIVCGIFSAETDSFFTGTATFVLGLAGLDLMFGYPVWETVVSNPLSILLFLAIYIAAGSAYAGLWRWVRYIKEHSEDINNSFLRWAREARKDAQPDDFETYLDSDYYAYKASKHKDKLAAWVLLWPFGLLWDLMHRPARWVFNTVYNNLGTLFDKIGKHTARSIQGKSK